MNILQITDELPPYVLGGSGRIAWETSRGLREGGHDVTVLTAAPAGTFPNAIDNVHIMTIPLQPARWAHYRSVFSRGRQREIENIIEHIRPDLIHAHSLAWQMGYRWIRTARADGIPVIYTAHGVMHVAYGKMIGTERVPYWHDVRRARWSYNPLRNALVKHALSRATILCVSDALREYLERRGCSNMRTLRNGIDLAFWKEATSQPGARRQLNLPEERMIFLLAGRLGHDKGLTAALSALPADADLILAGEGDHRVIASLGDRMHFFPKQSPEQMRLLYAACDAALVPSIYVDPFPTVCLESMACSRLVIATTFGGAKEAVVDGVTGWITDPRDAPQLRARLQWCSNHRSELPIFGHAARRHMEEKFSLDRYLTELLAIYDERGSTRS